MFWTSFEAQIRKGTEGQLVLEGTCNFIFILIDHILHVQISYQSVGFQRRQEILRFQFDPTIVKSTTSKPEHCM